MQVTLFSLKLSKIRFYVQTVAIHPVEQPIAILGHTFHVLCYRKDLTQKIVGVIASGYQPFRIADCLQNTVILEIALTNSQLEILSWSHRQGLNADKLLSGPHCIEGLGKTAMYVTVVTT